MSGGPFATLSSPLDPRRQGTKAAALARARAAGLPVPDGFVIGAEHQPAAEASGAFPETLLRPLEAALAALGPGPYAVRTSAPTEDLPDASAAGLYASELGARGPDGVRAAVERCWAASRTPSIRVYLESTGLEPPPVAVLVQSQIPAAWGGVLFTRDPRDGPGADHLLCELVPGSTTLVTAGLARPRLHRLPLGAGAPMEAELPPWAAALSALAPRLEALVGGPADAELAIDRESRIWVLQVRPITAFSPRPPRPDPGAGPLTWTWDAEHNPAPLSPLHASLVARLDRLEELPYRLRTVDGYLYTAARPDHRSPEPDPPWDRQGWSGRRDRLEERVTRLEELQQNDADPTALLEAFERFYVDYALLAGAPLAASHREWADALGAELERGSLDRPGLARRLAGVTTPLTSALRQLALLAAGADDVLAALEQGHRAAGSPAAEAFEARFASLLKRMGALAPAWDVATPTLAEEEGPLRRSVALLARRDETAHRAPAPAPTDAGFHEALQADEEDDLLFARALAALRRAFLARGERLVGRGELERREDVFWMDLDWLVDAIPDASGPKLRALIRERRQVGPAAPPAPILRGDQELHAGSSHGAGRLLRGAGCGGGTARAPAVLVESEQTTAPPVPVQGRIVVVAALLPSTVPWLVGAAGLVTDHGGLLSHGAILARELGIPAVLGTGTATRHICSGQQLWLDADQGVVIRLD